MFSIFLIIFSIGFLFLSFLIFVLILTVDIKLDLDLPQHPQYWDNGREQSYM